MADLSRRTTLSVLTAIFLGLSVPAAVQAQSAPVPVAAELPRGPVQTSPSLQTPEAYQQDLAPHRGQMEWWYVSSNLPDQGLAFHWAFFKVELLGRPLYLIQTAITNLKTNRLTFNESVQQAGAAVGFPPLQASQGSDTLRQTAEGFSLHSADMNLSLQPLKSAVRHPASGTPQTGQLEYQSITRLALSGQINGQAVSGLAWFDHQWGDQLPGRQAFWDWMGLQLSDGSELMLYRLRDAAGQVLQVYGTHVGADGQPTALTALQMRPVRVWTSSQGRQYTVDWTLAAKNLQLTVRAARDQQELSSRSSGVTYWEGPLWVAGTLNGQTVSGSGMGEFLSAGPKPAPAE